MRKRILTCTVLFCLIVSSAKLFSQSQAAATASGATPATAPTLSDPQTPEEFFARARQLSDLEASGIPFHLKATYVASGDTEFTGNGTYEEWWQSKDLWRKEATLGNFRFVSLDSPKGPLLYATSRDIPDLLLDAMDAALITIEPDSGPANNWRIKSKKSTA